MIYFVPIEPYEERYTEQWYRWWEKAFDELKVKYQYIDGEQITNKIEKGQVLDVYGTNYYKLSQLQKIIKLLRNDKINNDDVFLFADLWFPGIEVLQYIKNITGKNFKIKGILHAGTWDENDFTYKTGMKKWADNFEKMFLEIADEIFVATNYHKNLIVADNNLKIKDKIKVTGLPFDWKEVRNQAEHKYKQDIVVFPHRVDEEKNPQEFDKLTGKRKYVKSVETTTTKKEYYKLLGKSKVAVSFADQETFGYAMLEALALGCYPIMPNRLSYPEMYPEIFIYDKKEEVNKMTETVNPEHIRKIAIKILEKYEPVKVIKKMI